MFRRFAFIAAAVLVFAMAIAPGDALARAGASTSMGSRGSRTYSTPAPTGTANSAAPLQRSMTPQSAPMQGGYGAAPLGPRPSFLSGMMGGLLGVGLGGLLFGGMFHGGFGMFGVFGLLLRILVIGFIVRWIWRAFAGRPAQYAMAGGPAAYARTGGPSAMASAADLPPVTITPADYHAFEEDLHAIQAAWSAHDLGALRQLASPEMASYFAEQMAEQRSSGVINTVTDVRLDKGDLSEAWSEGGREYATVAMRFSMIDVTRDGAGRVVAGDPVRRTEATEFWTFLRVPGGRWVLTAIQQAR